MRSSAIQILFDLMGMMNLLVKFMNRANLKSSSAKASMVFVNLSLEARIFLERLNAEIIAQKHFLNVDLKIEGLENLKEPLILENESGHSAETILKLASNQLSILMNNYAIILANKELPPAMTELLESQLQAFKAYSAQLKKINLS